MRDFKITVNPFSIYKGYKAIKMWRLERERKKIRRQAKQIIRRAKKLKRKEAKNDLLKTIS